jgi:HTH-type transcriptional regulator/antitoxin HigA
MSKTAEFSPDWVSAPGRTVSELLRHQRLSHDEFAKCTCLQLSDVKNLLNGQLPITLEIAERLQNSVGGSLEFWLARDFQYREDSERLFSMSKDWVRQLPVSDMRRFGWLKEASTPANEAKICLNYFDVSSVDEWHEKYDYLAEAVLFRKTENFESRPAAVAAWLRQGEIEALRQKTKVWNPMQFEKVLHQARKLTREKDPSVFIPALQELCNDCGVALVIVRTPSGCPASGATRFLNQHKAMLLLSFRHLTDDHFWFSFFHEAAHLLLHHPERFVVEGVGDSSAKKEIEANEFAQDLIVPRENRDELLQLTSNSIDIIRFARKVGVGPGLIVGQLQHHKILSYNQQNRLKRRFEWTQS